LVAAEVAPPIERHLDALRLQELADLEELLEAPTLHREVVHADAALRHRARVLAPLRVEETDGVVIAHGIEERAVRALLGEGEVEDLGVEAHRALYVPRPQHDVPELIDPNRARALRHPR